MFLLIIFEKIIFFFSFISNRTPEKSQENDNFFLFYSMSNRKLAHDKNVFLREISKKRLFGNLWSLLFCKGNSMLSNLQKIHQKKERNLRKRL